MVPLEPDVTDRPQRTSLFFLILSLILLVLGGLVILAEAFLTGKWHWARTLPFLVLLALGITGLIARRLRPGGRLARALPDSIQGQPLDRQLGRGEVGKGALIVAGLIVLAWIAIQKKLL